MEGELVNRLLVLMGLTVFVFMPICYSSWLCSKVFLLAIGLGGLEWMRGMWQMAANANALDSQNVGKLAFVAVGLMGWLVPALGTVGQGITGDCPGHRKSMEAVAIVLLVSDSAQLGFGRSFGRHKFLPSISPKKTVEGYIGGLLSTICYGYFVHGWPVEHLTSVFIGGCLGDLYFSLAKRVMGLKDFSSLLGPHGGVCDRIDSYVGAWFIMIYLCDS